MFCSVIIPSVAILIHQLGCHRESAIFGLLLPFFEAGRRVAVLGMGQPFHAGSQMTASARPQPLILIVEDDSDIAELIALYLQKAGHRTDHVASGNTAVARV